MTTAIVGLLGVIVGGVLNGVVGWRLDLARQRRAGRAAARLVRSELNAILSEVEIAANFGDWRAYENVSSEHWQAHRTLLAETLSYDEFEIVSTAFVDTSLWRRQGRTEDRDMDDDTKRLIGISCDLLRDAMRHLEGHANDPIPWQSHARSRLRLRRRSR